MIDKIQAHLLAQKLNASDIGVVEADADTVIENSLNLAYFLLAAISVIMIIVAGIMYTSSAGNAGNVQKAKNMLIYAIAGLIISVSAFAITNFITGAFS